jgi:hypothetical protein
VTGFGKKTAGSSESSTLLWRWPTKPATVHVD